MPAPVIDAVKYRYFRNPGDNSPSAADTAPDFADLLGIDFTRTFYGLAHPARKPERTTRQGETRKHLAILSSAGDDVQLNAA